MRNDFIVTHKTKLIMGVVCTEVHDVVYLDGKLAEDTLDWYGFDEWILSDEFHYTPMSFMAHFERERRFAFVKTY